MRLTKKLRVALPEDLTGFCDALDAFDTVAYSCFSKILSMDFEKAIDDFLDFFIALETKTKSTKLHILFCYVKEFCRKNGYVLGVYSEQEGEAIHSRFSEFSRYKLPSDFHKETYKKDLLHVCFFSYNAERI